ncbi:MAG TPA: Hpt domain-containing protein [Bryobacteraceae bacterium]|nr:Hpt domain-containing protein [Bryobacteraceae bacterium]
MPVIPSETALAVLDLGQLRGVCMEDAELMREVATSLIDDTASRIPELAEAVEHADGSRCARVAHYVKGACANVGAAAMAAVLKTIEVDAKAGNFGACHASLARLAAELQKFSAEAAAL